VTRITATFQVEEVFGGQRGGRPLVRLLHPIHYHVHADDSPEIITVPAGFVTDFASIPWGLWNLFPPWGPHARPAIVHDFLYESSGGGWWAPEGEPARRYITRATDYTRAEADGVFREALQVVGVPGWRRTLMYRAVRAGGGSGWKQRGGPTVAEIAPPPAA
jgi:hypothetical protein